MEAVEAVDQYQDAPPEEVKRKRGRPLGSKNKPKVVVVEQEESEQEAPEQEAPEEVVESEQEQEPEPEQEAPSKSRSYWYRDIISVCQISLKLGTAPVTRSEPIKS